MLDIFKNKITIKRRYQSLNYILFFLLWKSVLVDLMNLMYLRNLNNYDSEIRLIIQGSGNQKLLNDEFDVEPSEVFVNGIQKN